MHIFVSCVIFCLYLYDVRLNLRTVSTVRYYYFFIVSHQPILTRDIFVGSNLRCYNDHLITVDPSIAGTTGFVYTFGEILNTGKTYV